ILNNSKWFPFFQNAIRAMDDTHINCSPSADEHAAVQNHKEGILQNTLACCDFKM
ncbi:hypothetical protein BDZ97DRAFT_1677001, partial [Flammula alnicola]